MRLHNRQIKATFWNDPDLLQWPRDKRWFFEGLTQLADDSACLEDSPFAFKLHLFPSPLDTDITVDVITVWVEELVQQRKLVRYQANGKACLFITNFHKHQALRSPAAPEVPLPLWVIFTPSEKTRRSGTYTINNPFDNLTLTVQSGYSDQPEPEPEPEREPEPEPEPESCGDEIIIQNFNVFKTFEQELGRPLSPMEIENIKDLAIKHIPELIKEAVFRAVAQRKLSIAYVRGILDKWERSGVKCLREALDYEEAYGKVKNSRQSPNTPAVDDPGKVVQFHAKRNEEKIKAACDFIRLQCGLSPPRERATELAREYGEEIVPAIIDRLYGGASP